MLKFIILFGILALATAATINSRNHESEDHKEKEPIAIVKSEAHRSNDGSFQFEFEGADGSSRKETGHIVNPQTDDEEIEVSGSYRYYDADGQLIEVQYTAGKFGFIPIGTNIPTEISLAAKAAAEAAEKNTE